jgi:hypothetical protein
MTDVIVKNAAAPAKSKITAARIEAATSLSLEDLRAWLAPYSTEIEL